MPRRGGDPYATALTHYVEAGDTRRSAKKHRTGSTLRRSAHRVRNRKNTFELSLLLFLLLVLNFKVVGARRRLFLVQRYAKNCCSSSPTPIANQLQFAGSFLNGSLN